MPRPPGKTFKERWPHEVEETRYLASSSYAVVLGGVLGVFMVPVILSYWLAAIPPAAAVVLASVALIPFTIARTPPRAHRWLALAWKIGAWVIGAALLGVVVDTLTLAICGEACRATVIPMRQPPGLLLSYGLVVVGSVVLVLVVDRVGNALRRRAVQATALG